MKINDLSCHFRFLHLLLIALVTILAVSCQNRSNSPFSKLEKEVLPTFELPPGFKIELIAAEPLVADPVDMAIDDKGHMYVVEMHGYPLDEMGVDDVVMLSDTDGDGVMDKRTVFADSLVLSDGVMPWKNGIIVTAAPNVLYLEDTTGDGKADIKKVMLTGFALSNPQHNLNHPRYGLDNWIYLAHQGAVDTKTFQKLFGDRGSDIFYPDHPDSPRLARNANGRIVRFRPDGHQLEEMSSYTQFGQTWDAWGHHFLVSNADHIFQEVIANRYLGRNRNLLVSSATEDLSDHDNACKVYPITKNPEHQLLTDVGVITSACSITDYLGGAFPDMYNNDNVTFVCEPVSNLIHVDQLKPKGATFTASRILDHKAFLASTDSWFRPVNMYIGPDGALYVLDYYREIIEHPEWMAEDVINSGKLYNGSKKGRIYRISANDGAPAKWTKGLHLKDATDAQLVNDLASKNIWWRRNAQRLLVDKNSNQSIPALVKMTKNTKFPLGRLHALWTLQGMNKLTPDIIEQALQDTVAGIRENAIKLAELHLKTDPGLTSALLKLADDADPKVRYQLLLTLGDESTPQVNEVRQHLLFKDIKEKWVQIAALSASSSQADGLLEAVLSKFKPDVPAYASLVQRLGAIIGASHDTKTIENYLQRSLNVTSEVLNRWQGPLINGIAIGLRSRKVLPPGIKSEQNMLVKASLGNSSLPIGEGALKILQAIGLSENEQTRAAMQKAGKIAENEKLRAEERTIAINFLTLKTPESYTSLLKGLLAPQQPLQVQLAALHSLNTIPGLAECRYVLGHWSTLSPKLRNEAVALFIPDPEKTRLLLDAIESNNVKRSDLTWPQSVRLMAYGDKEIKARARTLLSKEEDNRKEVIQKYKEALTLNGNSERGKVVFQKNCAICHQVRGKMGRAFGPDLGTVQAWDPETIMVNILDPNKSISHGYDTWIVQLNNGNSVQGIISTETPSAITLKDTNGQETTISREDIKSLQALGTSAMPIGLEGQINKQQMADLISFLKHNK